MKGNIQALGGLLVILIFPILIAFIWFDANLIWKILATDIVLIALCWIADKATD